MREKIGRSVLGFKPQYRRVFQRTLLPKRPSKETIEKHFRLIRVLVENEIDLWELRVLKDFTTASYVHFSESFPRKGTQREKTLIEEYEETLEKISRRDEELKTVEKEKGFQVHAGQVGIGVESKERKVPPPQ